MSNVLDCFIGCFSREAKFAGWLALFAVCGGRLGLASLLLPLPAVFAVNYPP
jgi:hypothetical protein